MYLLNVVHSGKPVDLIVVLANDYVTLLFIHIDLHSLFIVANACSTSVDGIQSTTYERVKYRLSMSTNCVNDTMSNLIIDFSLI